MSKNTGPGGEAVRELELNIVLAPKGMAVNAAKPVEGK